MKPGIFSQLRAATRWWPTLLASILTWAIMIYAVMILVGWLQSCFAQQRTDVDVRLQRSAGLIDTLGLMACKPALFVRVTPQANRGTHRGGEVWLSSTDDQHGLVHELGHNFMVTTPAAYFEWADSMRLDPWSRETQEVFADAFVGAVAVLYAAQRAGWPADDELPKDENGKKGPDLLARRLARRRPFRRRKQDDDGLDPWCLL